MGKNERIETCSFFFRFSVFNLSCLLSFFFLSLGYALRLSFFVWTIILTFFQSFSVLTLRWRSLKKATRLKQDFRGFSDQLVLWIGWLVGRLVDKSVDRLVDGNVGWTVRLVSVATTFFTTVTDATIVIAPANYTTMASPFILMLSGKRIIYGPKCTFFNNKALSKIDPFEPLVTVSGQGTHLEARPE